MQSVFNFYGFLAVNEHFLPDVIIIVEYLDVTQVDVYRHAITSNEQCQFYGLDQNLGEKKTKKVNSESSLAIYLFIFFLDQI